jgi:hypothetical protein
MPTTQQSMAAQRERRAAASAALVRRVVEEACNRGGLATLDDLLAVPMRRSPFEQSDQEWSNSPKAPSIIAPEWE